MCEDNKLTPKFLKFRIPKNGCFNANEVERFQAKLLKIELKNAKHLLNKRKKDTEEFLSEFRPKIPAKLIPTILLHTRIAWLTEKEKIQAKHQDKLRQLSIEQDRPIARMNTGTITILDNIKNVPEYVRATLANGPRHPLLTKFDEKAIAAEINALIEHHEKIGMSQDIINDINIASYRYIRDGRKQRGDKAIAYTSKYLKKEKTSVSTL